MVERVGASGVAVGERRMRILDRLAGGRVGRVEATRLCRVSAEIAGVTGAGIMLMSGDEPGGSVGATDRLSALIDQLQFRLGEGPGIDAFEDCRPVIEPNLARPRTSRWVAFSGSAVTAGVRAVFAFPLQVGALRVGAINLYRDQPGPLTDDQHADAMVMAHVACQAILAVQANAPPDGLALELDTRGDFHLAVHQASGMVAAQLEVGVGQALIRLRAYAFGHSQPLTDVAQRVVEGTLRFEQ